MQPDWLMPPLARTSPSCFCAWASGQVNGKLCRHLSTLQCLLTRHFGWGVRP